MEFKKGQRVRASVRGYSWLYWEDVVIEKVTVKDGIWIKEPTGLNKGGPWVDGQHPDPPVGPYRLDGWYFKWRLGLRWKLEEIKK